MCFVGIGVVICDSALKTILSFLGLVGCCSVIQAELLMVEGDLLRLLSVGQQVNVSTLVDFRCEQVILKPYFSISREVPLKWLIASRGCQT